MIVISYGPIYLSRIWMKVHLLFPAGIIIHDEALCIETIQGPSRAQILFGWQ
jgi:hypothetical protein